MGQVAGFRRPPADTAARKDEDESSDWSPRTRTLTVIGAALAAWVVVGAVIYLIGSAVWG